MADSPILVIRLMMHDDGGRPRIGVGFDKLGVRARVVGDPERKFDVFASLPTDLVYPVRPDTGEPEGMSCSKASRDEYLARRKKPLEKKQRVWEIAVADLPVGLAVVPNKMPDDPDHMLIVPAREMTLQEFVSLLSATQFLWRVVESN